MGRKGSQGGGGGGGKDSVQVVYTLQKKFWSEKCRIYYFYKFSCPL